MLKLIWDSDRKARDKLAQAWDRTFENTSVPPSDWVPGEASLSLPNYFEKFLEHLGEGKE